MRLKRFQNRPDLRLHTAPAHPLGAHNGGQGFVGPGEFLINQHVIVSAVIANLVSCVAQPPFDDCIGIFAARAQPLFQDLAGRGQDKNTHRIGNLTLQLSRTLHVNVEYQVKTLLLGPLQHPAVGAVIVAEDLGIFQKLAQRDALFEIRAGDKMIVTPVHVMAARRAGGLRDREHQPRHAGQQPLHQGGLARPGRRRDDEKQSS